MGVAEEDAKKPSKSRRLLEDEPQGKTAVAKKSRQGKW